MVERFRRDDGKVAVLISPDHGAGWSTWVNEEDEEALLFHAQIVKAVLDDNPRKAASLAARLTYHPRPAYEQQSHSAGSESNESSDSEMTMTAIIKNQLVEDSTTISAGADSLDPVGDPGVPTLEIMVDQVKAKNSGSLVYTEPPIIIDCGSNNSVLVAVSEEESARTTNNPVPVPVQVEVDNHNSVLVAGSEEESARTINNPVPLPLPVPVPVEVEVEVKVDNDAGKIAAVSSSVTTTEEAEKRRVVVDKKDTKLIMNDKEWLDYCTDYDKIDASWYNSYEYYVEHSQFDTAASTLIVEWLEPGEEFFVSEYDGYETLVRKSNFIPPPWHVA